MDYVRLKHTTPLETCAYCNAPLWNPDISGSTMDKLFAWQCHLGRCGGDGRRLQAHEVVKRALRDMVLSNPSPGGAAFPTSSVLIDSLHLTKDRSRLGDIMALGRDVHKLDSAMDIVIASALQKSCVTSFNKSSDIVLKAAEKTKFRKDLNSLKPIFSSSTMRFVPLALNHFGLRGPHFQAVLKEFATIMVTKPEGCSLLRGPFALIHSGALHKILRCWGSRLTWTAQREHVGNIVRGFHAFYDSAAFVMKWEREGAWEGG